MTHPNIEKLTDVSDIASAVEMAYTVSAIHAVQAKNKQDQLPNSEGVFEFLDCEDCGLEIGEGRLKVAARNLWCIFCATKKEKKR